MKDKYVDLAKDHELEYDKEIDKYLMSKKPSLTFCGDCQAWYPFEEQHICLFLMTI